MASLAAQWRAPLGLSPGSDRPHLYDTLVHALRIRRYHRRTEQTYCHWVKRFIHFRKLCHPGGVRSPVDAL